MNIFNKSQRNTHKCVPVDELLKLKRDDAYRKAGNCFRCKSILDFILQDRSISKINQWWDSCLNNLEQESFLEKDVDRLIDKLGITENDFFVNDFNKVIDATLPTLPEGASVNLFTYGKLLDPYEPYALHEILMAIRRGVSFKYYLPYKQSESADAMLLESQISKAIGINVTREMLTFDKNTNSINNFKKVQYIYPNTDGKNKQKTKKLIEIVFSSGKSEVHVWIAIPEKKEKQFQKEIITILQKKKQR